MAIVPISADDCDRAARSLRHTATLIDDVHERHNHLDLADKFEKAATHDRAPPTHTGTIPDRVDLPGDS